MPARLPAPLEAFGRRRASRRGGWPREAGDPDPERLVRAGLLHGLGRWAVAAVDPGLDRALARRDGTRGAAAMELATSAPTSATSAAGWPSAGDASRWSSTPPGCTADRPRHSESAGARARAAGSDPASLPLGREHALGAGSRRPTRSPCRPSLDCGSWSRRSSRGAARSFAAADATASRGDDDPAERPAHASARRGSARRSTRRRRLLQALLDATPAASRPRAGRTRAGVPGVPSPRSMPRGSSGRRGRPQTAGRGRGAAAGEPRQSDLTERQEGRPPSLVAAPDRPGPAAAEIQLWCDRVRRRFCGSAWRGRRSCRPGRPGRPRWPDRWDPGAAAAGPSSRRCGSSSDEEEVRAPRRQARGPGRIRRRGRPRAEQSARRDRRPRPVAARPDRRPRDSRSLRIILSQAQRTHRILRDLMFVARPPAPAAPACRRRRSSGPPASFQEECESRQIRLDRRDRADERQPGPTPMHSATWPRS